MRFTASIPALRCAMAGILCTRGTDICYRPDAMARSAEDIPDGNEMRVMHNGDIVIAWELRQQQSKKGTDRGGIEIENL